MFILGGVAVIAATENRVTSRDATSLQLSQSLKRLISESGYDRNRQKVADAVGVTPGALSLYVRGKATPRLEVLVRLANFFDVSLDLLVLGRQPKVERQAEVEAALRYMDVALAGIQDQEGRNARLVTRIGQALAKQIASAAAAASNGAPRGGVMDDNETLLLERYSLRSIILTTNLEYDVLHLDETQRAPGRFATVVADNLLKDRSYQFLLPRTDARRKKEQWQPMVNSFCEMLLEQNVPIDRLHRNCSFTVVAERALSGCGLYRVDLPALRKEDAVLLEWLEESEYISEDGWLGYLIAPNKAMRADSLLDREHLKEARAELDELPRRQPSRRVEPVVAVSGPRSSQRPRR
jgi:transcriptional regulator with XRE-family HTH domain